MKNLSLLFFGLALLGFAVSAADAQTYPGQRNPDQPRSQPGNQPRRPITTTGPAQAPTAPAEIPENRKPIPPETGAVTQPEPIEDNNFAQAVLTAETGLVALHMPNNRSGLGFLVAGKDPEHWLVVTTFASVAREPLSQNFWLDVRTGDNTKLEVEGLLNYDELQDLALVNVKAIKNLRKIKLLELSEADPKVNDAVYAVGSSAAIIEWASPGKVERMEDGANVGASAGTRWIVTDAIISGATRGGPLMNGQGRVAGLCAAAAGKLGRDPYLAAPASKIRALAAQEGFGSGRFPEARGAFRWPEHKAAKGPTSSAAQITATAAGMRRALDCSKCNGFGYLVSPVYTVDPNTRVQTKTGEKQTPCEDCGGAGIFIRGGLNELLANAGKTLLNADPKIPDEELAKARAAMQEAFDRAAVNRLVLSEQLTPFVEKSLAALDKARGEPVAFVAVLGPAFRDQNVDFQWIRPYGSETWILSYSATARGCGVRTGATQTGPGGQPRPPQFRPATQATGAYVLIIGILEGFTVQENNRKIYRAPLLRAADIIVMRS